MIKHVRAYARSLLIPGIVSGIVSIGLSLAAAHEARALVGGAAPADGALARTVVTIVGSRASFCSGALIAPQLVLTAAHCVAAGADYKLVTFGQNREPRLIDVTRVATHPKFSLQSLNGHRATADVAVLQIAEPLAGSEAAIVGSPIRPIAVGRTFSVYGIGVTTIGDGRTGGSVRRAALAATGRPGNLQIRLVDPATDNARAGLGACTGDSGAPVFETQNGQPVIVGVVSWSTGANNSAGCGGLTGVTPLSLYADWIFLTARHWGVALTQ